ncbi:hypothetical protein GKE82_19045 [Conexibacter sp. W3-3-2]|uniref:adenylate/guanylate cyclase domain-containing protein n=1 Tax=Conexibacter sp. W3-3-2 TaxID=2675227 RepID=UPI0012B6CFA7|nr:adenylate/guanylate cyclase domain-containing protein [Conexibacter sp. W3-3-2]MTD46326.1 hypothetical protein [Conexibacter sp. W3-3-2]
MDQTFIFADLAGFTAMTEVHGDAVAAEVAAAFCAELNRLMPAGGEDLKSLGDACMVLIPDAADAIRFGLRLVDEAAADRPFPEVRVGMHTGPAVQHGGDWFGHAVNIAARVAGRARGGQVLLTAATREQAPGLDGVEFDDLGLEALRNLRAPVPMFQASRLDGRAISGRQVDPVCRLRLLPDPRQVERAVGSSARFCSDRCAALSRADPVRVST